MALHPNTRATALTALVVVVDLASKAVAVRFAASRTGLITPVQNAWYSLGIIQGPQPWLVAGALITVAVTAYWYHRSADPARTWWVGPLVLGGALANLADRAVFGAVHDFIATPWVVFNIADVAVLIGLAGFYRDRLVPMHREGR